MFICHPAKLHPDSGHSEGLGTRIRRPQPGPSCQLPEMLSVPEEVVYRGDIPFLINVNHKGVQFFCTFSQVYNDNVLRFLKEFWRILGHTPPPHIGCFIHMVTIVHKHFSLDSSVLVFLGNFSSNPTSCEEGYMFLDCNQMPM